MPINLSKGQSISLDKDGDSLRKVRVGLGWDENPGRVTWDLDASAFGLTASGKVLSDGYFIFYKQLVSPDRAIEHQGDNLTGGNGANDDVDDETIIIDLDRLHSQVTKVAIAVSIYKAEQKRQKFGEVRNAYIRVFNDETGDEIARYDLTDEASTEPAVVFGEVYKDRGEWFFRATGVPFQGNLHAICRHYGVDVE